MRWETPIRIELAEVERAELETLARSHTASHGQVVRARIVLGVAAGRTLSSVAREVRCGRRIVRKWAQRFCRATAGDEQGSGENRQERFHCVSA